GPEAVAGHELPDGQGQAASPVGRVLLGPPAGRMTHGAAVPGGPDGPPVRVEQDGLDALRPDIRPYQVAHVPGSLIPGPGPGPDLAQSLPGASFSSAPHPGRVPEGPAASAPAWP